MSRQAATALQLPTRRRGQLGKRGAFLAAASVLALVLWSSGAPSTLYPSYAEKWDLAPVVMTSVFATYPLALIVVLPLFGNLSDLYGRRLVMIGGVTLIALSTLLFAFAPNVGFLFAGRALQGIGSGLAMGAATVSLIENNPRISPRFASTTATVATAMGLTLALFVSGLMAQYAPLPLTLSYIVLLVLAIAATAVLLMTPGDRPEVRLRWRPQSPKVPHGIRMSFLIATLSVALAYSMGAIFLSLGAHMIDQFAQTDNRAVVGSLLASSSVAICLTALLAVRVPARTQVWAGAVLTVVSLALMVGASTFGSSALFLSWCLVGGSAYSLAFTGGLGLINSVSPARHRGATLSLLYLIAYVFQAATAIGAGALATSGTLGTAVVAAAATLAGLCILVVVLLKISTRIAPQTASTVKA
ncbi:Predicted arabinose efflux permease, MFS family [Arthrobacter alpinus]|uniref:Predicted arabinose efflux permease, MFS family n=1 Tax=Arthrobacter alpinus TaxID=656366 RepID=A0A1H5LGA1_9MICC|nr:MFS transporter [Arthrobacter alpinus]SEE76085.1 Predicted arabinose efflux permease, MFS family [Arthrobacter alpinus]